MGSAWPAWGAYNAPQAKDREGNKQETNEGRRDHYPYHQFLGRPLWIPMGVLPNVIYSVLLVCGACSSETATVSSPSVRHKPVLCRIGWTNRRGNFLPPLIYSVLLLRQFG